MTLATARIHAYEAGQMCAHRFLANSHTLPVLPSGIDATAKEYAVNFSQSHFLQADFASGFTHTYVAKMSN